MYFASDNWAGAAPEIVAALAHEAMRFGAAYGESELDRAVEARFSEIFEHDVAVFFVATGSAANGLAMAAVERPGGVVFCHRESHMIEDECGGVEYLTGGARLFPIDGAEGKMDAAALKSAMARFPAGFVHSGQPMAVSVTQQTEAGGIYAPDQIRTIAEIAKERDLPFHMDGSRFANALAHLGVAPAEMTWKAGVDILSLGATKNGCIGAEAVVCFDAARAADLHYLRKRAGQLFSKSRFIAAQFDAWFRDGLWLKLARHANAMAARLRAGLAALPNAREAWATHGNEIFVVLDRADADRLRQAGARFHDWHEPHGARLSLSLDEVLVRLVTSFVTEPEEIDRLLNALGAARAA